MKLDKYTCCARLFPALIVSSPLLLMLFLVLPSILKLLGGISAAVGLSAAIVFLLGQCGRDMGKRKEHNLFTRMGGKPTTRLLRHTDSQLSPATKKRYHQYLLANVPGFQLPSIQEETADTNAADRMYDSAADWLRARTRDKATNELLLAENISYGFRRNLWAMKSVGIAVCIAGIITIDVLFIGGFNVATLTPAVAVALAGVMLMELAFWLFVARPKWVSVPAIAYARTLLEYCDR